MAVKRGGSDKAGEVASLEERIAALPSRPRLEVVEEWVRIYGKPPPKYIKRGLIERAVAWHWQAKVYGGLKPETRRYLLEVAEAHAKGSSETPVRKGSFKPGMRLVRQWHGKTYSVDVLDKGFAWNGRLYKSLSPIAKAITGAVWSGPRFFRP